MHPIEEKLQFQFQNADYLMKALTHKSFRNEQALSEGDNERLEFLGDAVLDLALSQILMESFPLDNEGALSKKRASLVNEDSLARVAQDLGLGEFLRVGKGERQTGGLQRPRLLASALEAILGAMFLDSNYQQVKGSVARVFARRLEALPLQPDYVLDFKTRLQERAQEVFKVTPTYTVTSETGPDHDKIFEVCVHIGEKIVAQGQGRNKKAAEQEAARQAFELFPKHIDEETT